MPETKNSMEKLQKSINGYESLIDKQEESLKDLDKFE